LASSDNAQVTQPRGPAHLGPGLDSASRSGRLRALRGVTGVATPKNVFLWPALLIILFLSIFPLIVSLYLSLSRLAFTPTGIAIRFVGFANYQTLLVGSERTHFLGLLRPPSPIGWLIFGVAATLTVLALASYVRGANVRPLGLLLRAIGAVLLIGLLWLFVQSTFSDGGRPGTVFVTLIYVAIGLTLQYLLGLGLAMLATLHLAGRRFFRVVFLLPMMITPVGIGYMFQMLTDTTKGPFVPLFGALGLQGFTWVNDPWGARAAVLIGDIWQWTPFMFIVLLAALEGQDTEVTEAALVDGANRRQVFTHITLPALLPVTTTILLIRMIEGFKIIDLPNILTNGGPGTATESLTLQAFIDWRTLNLGRSAAIAYSLLILVTIVATAYVALVRRRVTTNV
jgi:multiple sugar transport system permease protein